MLRRLYKVGLDGIFEQDRDGTGYPEIFDGKGLSLSGITEKDIFDTTTQILKVGSKSQDCHDLRGRGDVESWLAWNAVGASSQTRYNIA